MIITPVVIQGETLHHVYDSLRQQPLPGMLMAKVTYDKETRVSDDPVRFPQHLVSVLSGLGVEYQGDDSAIKLIVLEPGGAAVTDLVGYVWWPLFLGDGYHAG